MVKTRIFVSELPVLLWVNDEFVEIKADLFRVPNFQISHSWFGENGFLFFPSLENIIFFG